MKNNPPRASVLAGGHDEIREYYLLAEESLEHLTCTILTNMNLFATVSAIHAAPSYAAIEWQLSHRRFQMRNLLRESCHMYTGMVGSRITDSIVDAIALAAKKNCRIRVVCNGITVSVRKDSDPDLIYRDYGRAQSGCIGKYTRPYPKPILTEEELENDRRIKVENNRRAVAEMERCREAERQLKQRVDEKLANAPAIELIDKTIWNEAKNNKDAGMKLIFGTAERWARLMQLEMAAGERLEDVAAITQNEADLGMSGYSMTYVVKLLVTCWQYGERLRCWYNIDADPEQGRQANERGSILNPALLHFEIG